jgi:hypothetical protein
MPPASILHAALLALVHGTLSRPGPWKNAPLVTSYLDATLPKQEYAKTFERELFVVTGLLADAHEMGLQYLDFLVRDFPEVASEAKALSFPRAREIVTHALEANGETSDRRQAQ